MSAVSQDLAGFSEQEATEIVRDLFGIRATLHSLPGERDQNFWVDVGPGQHCVLKIANSSESRDILEAQNDLLDHVEREDPSLQCPRVLSTTAGDRIGTVQSPEGPARYVRLLSYVPGHLFVEVSPHPPKLLRSLGAFFGRLDRALANFSHPALRRQLEWDLRHANGVVAKNVVHMCDPAQRGLVEHFRQRFQEMVEPTLSTLRTGVIHNDGNDYNVLTTGLSSLGGEVTGVIDFGDAVETHMVCEAAVCAAYAIMGKTDLVSAAAQVIGGYHSANPLTEQELELLYDLIAMRLCTSVSIAARRRKEALANTYLTISEEPARVALQHLRQLSPRLFHYAFRHACGLPAHPRTKTLVQWLRSHSDAIGPVVWPDVRTSIPVVFDLTAGSTDFLEVSNPADMRLFSDAIYSRIASEGAAFGVGRYDEARRSYTTEDYRPSGSEVEEWRTVHLGIDLFLDASTTVFAPFDATVHSFRNNTGSLDYGPTIILRHEIEGAGEFFTLYGHLSVESLQGLSEGMVLTKGTPLGTIGDFSVNGQWPPHLHFQLIADLLDHSTQFPGVCPARDRDFWRILSPDPNLILQIPALRSPDLSNPIREPSLREILHLRERHLGPNLTVSYAHPLKLVRGWRQHLYDHLGREYLDATNNVSHVGHCHPTVVRAAARQMAMLNTNTRYLHDSLVEYAQRLCATLPEPLRICYFVCSGSEANELALRLARAYTHARDIIVVDGAYHGNTTTLVEISPYKFSGPGGAGPPPYVHTVTMPDQFRGPYKDEREAGRLYARHVRTAIENLQHQERRVGAFICESMLSCGGQIVLPTDYLAHTYREVRQAGGVCISDEVQTGLGRVGSHFWAFETQDVIPDIVTMGKPMGNGHPIGAVVTTPAIAASFANGMEYFNTFGGNPVSCEIGLAVLDVMEQEGLQGRALTTGGYLKNRLKCLVPGHRLIGDVRGVGLFLGIELVRDSETLEPATAEASYVAERMKELGILIGTDGRHQNVLKVKPPMVFGKQDADRFVDTLERVLEEPRLLTLRSSSSTRSATP